jgi:omega-3 fatty acid desaturase (delta-15 desaturase)
MGKVGRLQLPWALFAYPFYLWKRSPGKEGSHYDPACDLFVASEGPLVRTLTHDMCSLAILASARYVIMFI